MTQNNIPDSKLTGSGELSSKHPAPSSEVANAAYQSVKEAEDALKYALARVNSVKGTIAFPSLTFHGPTLAVILASVFGFFAAVLTAITIWFTVSGDASAEGVFVGAVIFGAAAIASLITYWFLRRNVLRYVARCVEILPAAEERAEAAKAALADAVHKFALTVRGEHERIL